MRTLVDIPDRKIEELAAICKTKHLSRAEAIRQAIDAFIEQNRTMQEQAFGLWNNSEDGLEYQERKRSEW